jgi:hypothetical protein
MLSPGWVSAIERVGISGNSGFSVPGLMATVLARFQIKQLVSGGCAGPLAAEADQEAARLGVPFICFQSNESVLQNADLLVSFWDGTNQEAYSVIDLAKRYNKPVLIIYPDGDEEWVLP